MTQIAQRLTAALDLSGLRLATEAVARLALYADALLALNREINLTAARDVEQILDVLLVPSVGVHAAWTGVQPPRRVLDIGSGNGFPGVAAAVLWPAADVLLVERRAKKARAITGCLEAAGITNAHALDCDAREVKARRPDAMGRMDLVTVRAVGALAETTALAAPFLAPGGCVVHWKGDRLGDDERAEGARAARSLGLEVRDEIAQPDGRGVFVVYARPAESRP